MIVKIKMTRDEKKLAEAYAKTQGASLDKTIKRVFFERIEDEYDVAIADIALHNYENNPKTFSLEEIKKEIDL